MNQITLKTINRGNNLLKFLQKRNYMNKSTVHEIKERFDKDVERFSNLATGQLSTIDADIILEIITESAKRIVPNATQVLDIGCGAGNYTLKMLSKLPNLNCTLVDLSKPMLEKAAERIANVTTSYINIYQGDIRTVNLKENHYDIILAGAVLHHLRTDKDWENVFTKLFKLLKPNGCLMVSDLVTQDTKVLDAYSWDRYGEYLVNLKGEKYRDQVLAYIEKEDSPRSINYQLNLMIKVGFKSVEIMHKNICFGAFGGIK